MAGRWFTRGRDAAGSADATPAPAASGRGPGARRSRPRLHTVSIAFVILTLIALVLLPILSQRQVASMREQIGDVAEPARYMTNEIQAALGRELSAAIGFGVTEREFYRDEYRQAAATQSRALTALDDLASELGAPVADRLATLRALQEDWHDRVAAARLFERDTPATVRIQRLFEVYPAYERTAAAAAELRDETQRVVARRRGEIRAFERFSLILTGVLVVPGVLACLVVFRIGGRLRTAAAELRSRAETEEALRRASEALGAAPSVLDVYRGVASSAVDATGATGGYIERTEAPGADVEVVASTGAGVPGLGTRVPYPGSLTEAMVEHGRPELMAEAGEIGQSMASYLAETCSGCSALVVPLMVEDEPLGTLVLLRRPSQPGFGPVEVDQARTLGDLASAALRRTLLVEALRESEERFRALAENAADGIITVDENDRILFVNRAAERIFGHSRDEMLAMSFRDLIAPRFRESVASGMARYLMAAERGPAGVELPGVARDGRVLPLEVAFGEYSADGTRLFSGIIRDVSERRRADAERERLLESEREARAEAERRAREEAALREAAAAVTATFTVDRIIRQIARSAVEATGAAGAFVERIDIAADEIEIVAVAGDRAPRIGERIPFSGSVAERVVETGRPETIRNLDLFAGPVFRRLVDVCPACAALVLPLLDAGEAIGILVLLREPEDGPFHPDEVERAHTFAELAALAFRKVHLLEDSERRRVELQQVIGSRERLMRGFSHDVKNPLGAADGHLQLLADEVVGTLNDKQKESVERSRRSIASALELIEALVDLARAEAGSVELEIEASDIREIAREIAEEYRPQAERRGLALELDLAPELPPIESDPSRVRQILGNLISNAVKYTDEGRVTVRVAPRAGEAREARREGIVVEVSDTGPGIPEEQRHLLFREFSRIGPTGKAGAGLGLAISQRLADLLGGEITVESEVGVGSTFALWLPKRRNRTQPADPRAAAD